MSLGEKIKKLRNEKGLSQEKFGKQSGIHPNHVGKYEANKTVPSADNLRKIAEVLEVSSDYLLFDDASRNEKIKFIDPERLERFMSIDKMDEKDRDTIKNILDAMILKNQVIGLVEPIVKMSAQG